MRCSKCGHAMSAGARFCGGCGATVEGLAPVVASDPSVEPAVGDLQRRLADLAGALREAGTPEYIGKALDSLAGGPAATATHLTVVVGEKGRGKTTLVNRLLGLNALPTGRGSYGVPILVRASAEWQIVDTSGGVTATALPVQAGLQLEAVEGPAAVLGTTALLDTPPLNEVDLDFEERVVAELVHADTFLVCVAANQMLSQKERDLIRGRLLPLLGGDGALVVTHADFMETDGDRRDIRSRAQRFAGDRLRALFLPADPAETPVEVLQFIEESVCKKLAQQTSAWHRKVAALIGGIEGELSGEPEEEVQSQSAPSKEERLRAVRRLLESEHSLALAEAEAALQERLGSIRIGLSHRVAQWTPEYAQHEGAAEVSADVQAALRDATQLYISSLEQSLTSGVPRSIQIVVDNVAALAPDLGDAAGVVSEPESVEVARQRDVRVPLLTLLGIALLRTSVPPIAVVGALFMSRQMEQKKKEASDRQGRANAREALSSWIAGAEPELLEQLRQVLNPVLTDLVARAESIIDSTPSTPPASRQSEILAKVRECLALTMSIVPSQSVKVNT